MSIAGDDAGTRHKFAPTHVAVFLKEDGEKTHWPAMKTEDGGLLIDVRNYDGDLDPEWLLAAGVPAQLVEAASLSFPQGYGYMGPE